LHCKESLGLGPQAQATTEKLLRFKKKFMLISFASDGLWPSPPTSVTDINIGLTATLSLYGLFFNFKVLSMFLSNREYKFIFSC